MVNGAVHCGCWYIIVDVQLNCAPELYHCYHCYYCYYTDRGLRDYPMLYSQANQKNIKKWYSILRTIQVIQLGIYTSNIQTNNLKREREITT